MDENTVDQPKKDITENLTDDFASVYANNFHFEISAWDLKIMLGQLNQSSGKAIVDWHTAATMPWGSAKLFHYLLGLNIAIYESNFGRVKMHHSVIPDPPVRPDGDQDTPENRAFYDLVSKMYADLVAK